MKLNTIKSGPGARPTGKRVGRGIGSGLGKTCGKGGKGQTARAGGYHKVGFEGGQMPLQRRLPKAGFKSHLLMNVDEVRLNELARVEGDVVDLVTLKAANLVRQDIERVRIIASGTIGRKLTVRGLHVTKGARAAIEAAGGTVEA